MYPAIQLWGIIAGLILIALIGMKAFIGGAAAILAGTATYYLYGKKYATIQQTPFHTLRNQLFGNTDDSSEEA